MSGNGWALTFGCNRADAESVPELGDILPDLADPPSLNVEEPDPHRPDDWRLTAYFAERPDDDVTAAIVALFASARDVRLEPLPDADWTTLSQRDLVPVRAGRFLVHTAAHDDAVRPGDIALRIEAGLAFGTGQHATTHGCLAALDALARRRRFRRIADVGTGTGVLALAAGKCWRKATVTATDIDPVSITVTRENVLANREAPGRLRLAVAPGTAHRALDGPFDLILANILAPPLIAMARDLSARLAPGGILVLAGLLDVQARAVLNAYRRHGLVPVSAVTWWQEWPCLVLEKRLKARGKA